MAEIPNDQEAIAAPESNLVIHKLYVKDLSFESPSTPTIFNENWEPRVDINVQNTAVQVGEGIFEVVLTVTVTAKLEEQPAFLVEVQQAGLFQISDMADDEIRRAIGATCPTVLYPYAREVVSDLIVRGGFPPLWLAPADFESAYEQRLAAGEG